MQRFGSNSALFWAPEKAGLRYPLQIFSPHLALGTLGMQGLCSKSALFCAPNVVEPLGEDFDSLAVLCCS